MVVFASELNRPANGNLRWPGIVEAFFMIRKINVRELLRKILTTTWSNIVIGAALCVAPNTVRRYRLLVQKLQFEFSQLAQLDNRQLYLLFNRSSARLSGQRMPKWSEIHDQLQQKCMTCVLLWEEYREIDPSTAYSYAQFTFHYRRWLKRHRVTMRLRHRPGESVFVDFAGKTIAWTDKATGKQCKAQIFVACLGASNYTFVYAVPSQSLRYWIDVHVRMIEFFGGVPERIVPDNLKAAVIKAGRFPVINPVYLDFATHCNTSIVPARAGHPQDKGMVENAVRHVTRWILLRLRNRTFFSIEEINAAIAELLEDYNNRPFKRIPGTRRTRFESLEKPALRELPTERFEFAEWIPAQQVPSDYHVSIKQHLYSVPYTFVGESVEARVGTRMVEIMHEGKRIATHLRDDTVGESTTAPEHRSDPHRFYADATPDHLRAWATTVGPQTLALCDDVYARHPHHQPATDFCLAVKRLAEKGYDSDVLETAAAYARERHIYSITRFRSIAKRQAKGRLTPPALAQIALPLHDNVRGESYYR